MATTHLKHSDITGKIIKCGFAVHDFFGHGFPEIVYKRALVIEMDSIGLDSLQEVEKPIYYKDQLIYKRKIDLLVESKILVEMKAIKELDAGDINQILNYLKVYKIEVGLLLNFGKPDFFFKRFVLNEKTKFPNSKNAKSP